MRNKKRGRVLIICLILIVLLAIVLQIRSCLHIFGDLDKAVADSLPSTYNLLKDDSVIIAKKYLGDAKAEEILHNKFRRPTSFLSIGKKYEIVIFRFDLQKTDLFKNLFDLNVNDNNVNEATGYYIYGNDGGNNSMTIDFKYGPVQPITKLYLSFTGNAFQNFIQNDSIRYFNVVCDGFSIKNSKKGPVEILSKTYSNHPLFSQPMIPMDILFLNRSNCLYMLLLTPYDTRGTIPPMMLYKIVTGG